MRDSPRSSRSAQIDADSPSDDQVPDGWTLVSLPDVVDINPPKPPSDMLGPDAEVTFVPMPAVDERSGSIAMPQTRAFSQVRKGYTSFRDGDVIMAKITPCMENGKAAVARGLCNGVGFGSTEFHVFRARAAILPEYLYHFVRQAAFRRNAEDAMTGSVGQKRVPREFLEKVTIPLPPLAEQERILELLAELLTRLESCCDRLERVPSILSRLRRAVLAAACSGGLTEEWRTAKALPEWTSFPLEALLKEPLMNGRSVPDADHGFPVLRLTAIRFGRIDLRERKIGAWTAEAASRFRVRCGDFYIARGNGSLALVGRGGLVTDEPDPVAFPDTFIRVRVKEDVIRPRYLQVLWDSDRVRTQIEATARTTAGIFKISQRDLEGFVLPVPSVDEQDEIVRRVSALMTFVDSVESRVVRASKRARDVREGVLTRAFRGALVPTEVDVATREGRGYETAEDLLARIRREGNAPASSLRPRRPRGEDRR